MNIFRDKAVEANATYYMTLVAITQSLALGYFFTTLDVESLVSSNSSVQIVWNLLIIILILQMVVITWHEYSIGTVLYKWPMGMADSWIPILLLITEYFVITFASKTMLVSGEFETSATALFFGSIVAFMIMGFVAYLNQYKKVTTYEDYNKDILESTRKYMRITFVLMAINIVVYIVATFVALKVPNIKASIVILLVGNFVFLVHSVRMKSMTDKVFA